jgi:uncharacterized DUF497 family protein
LVNELLWPEERILHIGKHNVEPHEFEEVCFGRSLVLQAKSTGLNPVLHVLGQTEAGRYLLCIVVAFPDGRGYPVTARDMTAKEMDRFKGWKR